MKIFTNLSRLNGRWISFLLLIAFFNTSYATGNSIISLPALPSGVTNGTNLLNSLNSNVKNNTITTGQAVNVGTETHLVTSATQPTGNTVYCNAGGAYANDSHMQPNSAGAKWLYTCQLPVELLTNSNSAILNSEKTAWVAVTGHSTDTATLNSTLAYAAEFPTVPTCTMINCLQGTTNGMVNYPIACTQALCTAGTQGNLGNCGTSPYCTFTCLPGTDNDPWCENLGAPGTSMEGSTGHWNTTVLASGACINNTTPCAIPACIVAQCPCSSSGTTQWQPCSQTACVTTNSGSLPACSSSMASYGYACGIAGSTTNGYTFTPISGVPATNTCGRTPGLFGWKTPTSAPSGECVTNWPCQ